MYNMPGSLLLLALVILPSALPKQIKDCISRPAACAELSREVRTVKAAAEGNAATAAQLLVDFTELVKIAQVTQNATSQLLAGLQTLRGPQAVSASVQVSQVLMFVGYLLTIFIVYMVKR